MGLLGKRNSISARLTMMNLLVSGIALLLAFASFVAYDAATFRHDLARSLETETHILGANLVSPLLFEDQQAATTTLAALRGSPDVISAVLLGEDGQQFAEYTGDAGVHILNVSPLPANGGDGQWNKGNDLLYGSRIVFQGKQVGTIYILASTGEQRQRAWRYALIAALVLILCMAIALLLTTAFRQLIADPLIELARTAQVVRDEKDYSVRAQAPSREDELALVVRSFNEMLAEIQERDKELEQSRVVLEERVQQRTAELSAANKELEAFSYTVAHDLRGPLDVIANIGFLLKDSYSGKLDAEGSRFLDQLLAGTRKMSNLIQDLLNLSRASRMALRREVVDLAGMASSILDKLTAAEPERRVEIIIPTTATVVGDEGLLCVVMENLLGNAWKYSSKQAQTRIEFGVTEIAGETVYFVRDNGTGFDPAYADRLFQPFQRLHGASEFPGTGIGLATVFRIIRRHGGRVWAESSPHSGAAFYFTVPYGTGQNGNGADVAN